MNKEVILKTEDLSQHFGGLIALNKMNFELRKGEIVGLIGPNGAGKTTFFNNITGVYPPTSGRVLLNDKEITSMKPCDITALGMARTFQNIRLFYRMTALENVMLGTHVKTRSNVLDSVFHNKKHRQAEKDSEKRALEVLEMTGLADYRYDYATSLPYGLQRRLEIARAMASDPQILLFDEPAAGMNEQETTDLIEFITSLKDIGYSILLIEHDMKLVMSICDRIYVLDHGNLIASGIPSEIRNNEKVIEAYLGKDGDM